DFAGDSDTAIAIRTALLRDGTAYVQAGGRLSVAPPKGVNGRNFRAWVAFCRAMESSSRVSPGHGQESMTNAQ
ncbi:anthranilate synthase component I, partial [Streptomyces acidicola]